MIERGDYRPWRDAAGRPDIEVMVCDLPAGVRAIHARSSDGHRAILVSRSLPPVERLAALAHELVHDERGGGCHHPDLPERMRVLVMRDEAHVDQEAADRLLPSRCWPGGSTGRVRISPSRPLSPPKSWTSPGG